MLGALERGKNKLNKQTAKYSVSSDIHLKYANLKLFQVCNCTWSIVCGALSTGRYLSQILSVKSLHSSQLHHQQNLSIHFFKHTFGAHHADKCSFESFRKAEVHEGLYICPETLSNKPQTASQYIEATKFSYSVPSIVHRYHSVASEAFAAACMNAAAVFARDRVHIPQESEGETVLKQRHHVGHALHKRTPVNSLL